MKFDDYFDEFTRRDWQERSDGGPVRFALIGLGWFTRAWALPGMEKTDLCEPTVAISGSKAKAEGVAEEHELESRDHLRGVPRRERHGRLRRDLRRHAERASSRLRRNGGGTGKGRAL